MSDIQDRIRQLILQQQLPDSYQLLVEQYLLPLSLQIIRQQRLLNKPIVVAINGGQGSGKSTLCLFLKCILEYRQHKEVVVLSLDDFYLNRADREKLANDIHPLLKTRGVPGTHDVKLAQQTLDCLLKGETVKLPQFNKAEDECISIEQWPTQINPVDIILLEGWCVGANPQSAALLANPINSLEKSEDSQGVWREYVNQCLREKYQQWFAAIDYLVMLKVPDIDSVYRWRGLQEKKLKDDRKSSTSAKSMYVEKIERFVQHFERLTLHQLEEMPQRADVVFKLNKEHGIDSASGLIEICDE